MSTETRTRRVIGCMTGTSLDALDASLVELRGRGLDMRATLIGTATRPLGDLAATLREMGAGHPHAPIDYLRAARALGQLYRDAVLDLMERFPTPDAAASASSGSSAPPSAANPKPASSAQPRPAAFQRGGRPDASPAPPNTPRPVDFVVAHGQTIWHAGAERLSWQLFDPWPIVRACGVPVCYDLRQADLVAGGEGAPITPIADWVMFHERDTHAVVLNLGGVCNYTELPPDNPAEVRAGDLCPCNLVIDGVVRALYPDRPYDRDGELARRGRVHALVFERLASLLQRAKANKRTLGREDVTPAWIEALIRESRAAGLSEADVVASAVDAVGRLIGRELDLCLPGCEVILAGGGAKNPALAEAIRRHGGFEEAGVDVVTSDQHGVPVESRESMGFAVLGALSADGVAITLPRVTGSERPGRAGVWAYP